MFHWTPPRPLRPTLGNTVGLTTVLTVRLHLQLSFVVPAFMFRVSVFEFSGFGFRVSDFVSRVLGFGFRVSCFVFRVSGFGFRVLGFGFRVRISVQGVGAPPLRA